MANPTPSEAPTAGLSNLSIATPINHPTLRRHDAESTRVFLRKYDQYVTEISERAAQYGDTSARPVQLKFCVDSEYLSSAIGLGFIKDITKLEDLTDAVLRTYLDKKAETSKETVTLSSLDRMVDKQLSMNMADPSATSRMQALFISYYSLLRKSGLTWVLEESQKVAVQHVLSAISPKSLRDRLSEDLEFSQRHLRKDFKAFMAHSIKLAEAFQLIDSGRNRKRHNGRPTFTGTPPNREATPTAAGTSTPVKDESDAITTTPTKAGRKPPYCIMPECKAKKLRHYFAECPADPTEIQKMKESLSLRPSDSTRSKSSGSASRPASNKVSTFSSDSPRVTIDLESGISSTTITGQCDDGSDDSLASPDVANNAVLNGIGSFKKIQPVKFEVALTRDKQPQEFTFSKVWTVPRTVLHLSSGKLAVLNISFLVADDDLTAGGILIGRPVLRHMRVDTKTLLESNRDALDGIDCANVGNPTVAENRGHVSAIMSQRASEVEKFIPIQDPLRPRVDYFQSRKEIDPFPDASLLDRLDADQAPDVQGALDTALAQAGKNGLQGRNFIRLQNMANNNLNIFRVGLSAGAPANITPLRIQLSADATPTRVKLRNYSREQRQFLSDFVQALQEKGMIYPNPSSRWACAPLLVPKPGESRFRFTVDLRPVNRYTIKYQFPMPDVEVELTKLAGAKYFATFDFSHGYWQLPLHKDSQESQTFITPDGLFSPTRVLHGTSNATMHMQAEVNAIIGSDPILKRHSITWLDDVLLFAYSIEEHLDILHRFFEICRKARLRLHPAKSSFYSITIRWCGRLIDKDGIKFDPRRINGLLEMATPNTGSELQQFLCAFQWMKTAVPEFNRLIEPLHLFMEEVYARAGKRTKTRVARVALSEVGWTDTHTSTFIACKDALAAQVKLSHRDASKRLCVFTDASDSVWSGVITQVPISDVNLPHSEKRHEPLAFLSGRFDATQLRWSTLEKEAYAIMATTERMHWILSDSAGFDIYTDHNNLVFIFDPLSVLRDISLSSLKKVLRWAVRLSVYNYTCIHIPGSENVWADLLSRWAVPNIVRRIIRVPALPSSSADDFIWPDNAEIAEAQHAHISTRPKGLTAKDGLFINDYGAIWIPADCSDLQLRICIIAHTSSAGHRGIAATESAIRRSFHWTTITEDVDAFIKGCIHCLSTLQGKKIPRPFGPAVHGTYANDLVQFDFLEIAPGRDGVKYILMVRDDFSSFCWLFPFANANSANTCEALLEWCSTFNVPSMFMSDQGTHFKNEVLRRLCRALRVPHHFTLPHTPWSNGAVERLGREVLRVFRATASELRMPFSDWPDLVPLVQSSLNNSPSPQRGNKAPITIFIGAEPRPAISTFLRHETGRLVSISDAAREQSFNLGKVKDIVDKLRETAAKTLSDNRQRKRDTNSRGALPNFSEGDFVLLARDEFTAGEKLCLRWRGPRRITRAVSDYVYQIEDLRNGALEEAHASRLRFYSDDSLNKDAIMPHVISSETGMPVQRLMRLEESPNGLHVIVRWRGLPANADTSEPLSRIYEDVPQMLLNLLKRKSTPRHLVDLAKKELGL